MGIIAGGQGAVVAGLSSFAFAGALVGFLRYNAPPARVYLGDTGSMLIGWLVADASLTPRIPASVICPAEQTCVVDEPVYDAMVDELQRMGASVALRHNTAVVQGVSKLYGASVMATLRNLLLGLMEIHRHRGKTKARTFPAWRRKLTTSQKVRLITRDL